MLTVIGDIGDLEATGAVGLACLEVDPELSGAGCECNGALVGLAGLVGGDGGWGGWEGKQQVRTAIGRQPKPCCMGAVGVMVLTEACPHPRNTHTVFPCPGSVHSSCLTFRHPHSVRNLSLT